MKKFVKELFTKEWNKDEQILMVSVAALAGIVIGVMLSPLRGGIKVLSGNGSYNSASDCGIRDSEEPENEEV